MTQTIDSISNNFPQVSWLLHDLQKLLFVSPTIRKNPLRKIIKMDGIVRKQQLESQDKSTKLMPNEIKNQKSKSGL